MDEYISNLQLRLTSPRRGAPGTLSSYTSTAKIFLTWLGDHIPPTEKDLRRYFLFREEAGIRSSTRRTEFQQLKLLFEANEWKWPFTRRDRPAKDKEKFAPAFTRDEILQLIEARENYSAQENFYLALATTYGVRSEEMGRITPRDLKDTTVYIRTAKGGDERLHLIPEEILPVLSSWTPRKRGSKAVRKAFKRIMKKSGLGDRPGWNFHAIRRTLNTLLIINLAKNDYPPSMAAEYLRWAKESIGREFLGSPMAGYYAHPEVISMDPFQLDRVIHSIHPFLAGYRNQERD